MPIPFGARLLFIVPVVVLIGAHALGERWRFRKTVPGIVLRELRSRTTCREVVGEGATLAICDILNMARTDYLRVRPRYARTNMTVAQIMREKDDRDGVLTHLRRLAMSRQYAEGMKPEERDSYGAAAMWFESHMSRKSRDLIARLNEGGSKDT